MNTSPDPQDLTTIAFFVGWFFGLFTGAQLPKAWLGLKVIISKLRRP